MIYVKWTGIIGTEVDDNRIHLKDSVSTGFSIAQKDKTDIQINTRKHYSHVILKALKEIPGLLVALPIAHY